jgi:hypothetical protein
MGTFTSKTLENLVLYPSEISKLDKDHITYFSNYTLQFDKEIQRKCFEILSNAKDLNWQIFISYEKGIIYEIHLAGNSYQVVSPKLMATMFGYVLKDSI